MIQNRFQRQPQPPKREPTEKKCKIVVKRKQDGTMIKEIQGECSKEQLRALSEYKDLELY